MVDVTLNELEVTVSVVLAAVDIGAQRSTDGTFGLLHLGVGVLLQVGKTSHMLSRCK